MTFELTVMYGIGSLLTLAMFQLAQMRDPQPGRSVLMMFVWSALWPMLPFMYVAWTLGRNGRDG